MCLMVGYRKHCVNSNRVFVHGGRVHGGREGQGVKVVGQGENASV